MLIARPTQIGQIESDVLVIRNLRVPINYKAPGTTKNTAVEVLVDVEGEGARRTAGSLRNTILRRKKRATYRKKLARKKALENPRRPSGDVANFQRSLTPSFETTLSAREKAQ